MNSATPAPQGEEPSPISDPTYPVDTTFNDLKKNSVDNRRRRYTGSRHDPIRPEGDGSPDPLMSRFGSTF